MNSTTPNSAKCFIVLQSYVTDNFRDKREEVGRLSIYKHSTQDRYHLVTTFRLECDYEEITERDRRTNMTGLIQQHRPFFSLNPESHLSTPRDIETVQHSQPPLHPAVPLHGDGSLHLFFGRSNLFLLPTGMCACPNIKISTSLNVGTAYRNAVTLQVTDTIRN
jgi:hypothetical protein